MCCMRLAETFRTQKLRQKSPSAHHRTNLSGYIFATTACIDNRKKLVKWQYLLHRLCFHNMVKFSPITAEICWRVWGTPANFKGIRVLASLLHQLRSTEDNQTLHDVWLFHELVHYIYIFGGSCPPNGILPAAKVTLRPSLAFSYIGSVTARHSSTGVSQSLRRHSTRSGITELLQRASPIFGRVAITLGIGPHSSLFWFLRLAHRSRRRTGFKDQYVIMTCFWTCLWRCITVYSPVMGFATLEP